MENLPLYVPLTFALTTIVTLLFFGRAINLSKLHNTKELYIKIGLVLMLWLVIQWLIAICKVYSSDTDTFPPNIMLFAILPPILVIVALFLTEKGRQFIDSLDLKTITILNVMRIPVELVLFLLFSYHTVPELMTFEGRNVDILAGLTAPPIAYLTFYKKKIRNNGLLLWNIICLALLINIVVNAILSAPSPIQKFGFEQPNIALLHFPFSWLPSFIVPVVLFGHLASIRQLIIHKPLKK